MSDVPIGYITAEELEWLRQDKISVVVICAKPEGLHTVPVFAGVPAPIKQETDEQLWRRYRAAADSISSNELIGKRFSVALTRAILAAAPPVAQQANTNDAKDAARYRAMRRAIVTQDEQFPESVGNALHDEDEITEKEWDAAIDAAIAATSTSKEST